MVWPVMFFIFGSMCLPFAKAFLVSQVDQVFSINISVLPCSALYTSSLIFLLIIFLNISSIYSVLVCEHFFLINDCPLINSLSFFT